MVCQINPIFDYCQYMEIQYFFESVLKFQVFSNSYSNFSCCCFLANDVFFFLVLIPLTVLYFFGSEFKNALDDSVDILIFPLSIEINIFLLIFVCFLREYLICNTNYPLYTGSPR